MSSPDDNSLPSDQTDNSQFRGIWGGASTLCCCCWLSWDDKDMSGSNRSTPWDAGLAILLVLFCLAAIGGLYFLIAIQVALGLELFFERQGLANAEAWMRSHFWEFCAAIIAAGGLSVPAAYAYCRRLQTNRPGNVVSVATTVMKIFLVANGLVFLGTMAISLSRALWGAH